MKAQTQKKKKAHLNGWLRLLLGAGILVALFVLAEVHSARQDAKNRADEDKKQREEFEKQLQQKLLETFEFYDSLSAMRLENVAQQAHPKKKIRVPRISRRIKTEIMKAMPSDSNKAIDTLTGAGP